MLLFSAFVIAVHGRLLADLMLTLKLEQDFDLRAITLVPVLFVLSAFQLEGAQWSFIQCVLLQNICGLVAAIYAVRWLGDCKNSNLYKSLVAVAVAPLFQATGFINPAFVILILIFAGRYRHTLTLKTLLFYIALAAIALIPSLITYWAFALPSPGTSAFADFLAEPRKFFPYVLSFFLHGIFAVTFMRGLSLFPSLLQEDLRAAHWMHTLGVEQLYFSNGHESVVITFGIIVFAALAVLLLLERRRTLNFKLLLLGSFVMTLFFILPAMGRYTFGIPASLYLRYQTRELIGLLLILLPLLSFYLFEARKIVKVMAWLALSYHFFIQTKMSTTNPYFAEKTIRVMEVICRLETEKSRHLLQTGIKNAISNDWEYSPERLRYVLTHYELGCKHELDS